MSLSNKSKSFSFWGEHLEILQGKQINIVHNLISIECAFIQMI